MIASEAPCLPFDVRRTGLNLGEGAGIMVLERAQSAQAREATPLARLLGYATCADAHHPTAPHPAGAGLRRAMAEALRDAGVGPDEIGLVNAHGTSTPDNDRVEGASIAAVLGTDVPVVSTKACTGHTLGAAGGIEAVFAARHLAEGRVPATVGFAEADPNCVIEPTRAIRATSGDYAVSNSLAFGGNNSVLVFGKA